MKTRQKQAGIIRIKAEGTRFKPRGADSDRLPPNAPGAKETIPAQDETTELRQDFTFDFVGQRYRHQYSEKLGTLFDSWVQVNDGKKIYGSKVDVPIEELDAFRPTDLSVVVGGGKANIFTSSWWPYLMSAGCILTDRRRPYYLTEFVFPIDDENIFIHGPATADGVPCWIVRVFPYGPKGQERFLEYAIGRNDGAVRRCTDWSPGPRKDIEITISYRKSGEQLVPTSWTNEWYQSGGKPRLYQAEKMKVVLYQAGDVPTDRFILTPEVGASIRERQYPKDIQVIRPEDEKVAHYRVDESGNWVEGSLVDGEFQAHRRWVWWSCGLSLLAVFGVMGWRHTRRQSLGTSGNPQTGGST
jgi:hypothetical protein